MPDLYMDVDIALSEVPVNLMPLLDDTDFKTRETAIAYNAAGMDLVWNFVTTGGAFTQTAVTPTTGGDYDWTHQGDGIYTIEIPASGGASINNDTEGFGWFTGLVTGVLPWRGPTIGFRAAGINDALIDGAYSTTRGLAGTALPNAAAEAAGGLFTRGTGAGQINQAANGQVDTNAVAISGDATAADNAESFFDGTGYAGTNNVIPTVTTLTNAPSDSSGVTTLLSRLTATRAGYLDNLSAGAAALEASVQSVLSKLLKYVQLILRSDAAIATDNATELTAINADGGSGAGDYANTTDATEAIRDRGDAAWTTGAGGSNPAVLQNTTIATLASQTSFTLTAGSADDNAYNGHLIVVTDQATAEQKAVGVVLDYVGSTKTVTLAEDPGIFTMAVGDEVDILVGKVNVVAINSGLTNGNNATLSLAQLNIVNSGGSAIVASSTGSNGHGIAASGNGNGEGLSATGGSGGHGIHALGGSGSGNGILAQAQGSPGGEGFKAQATAGPGASFVAGGAGNNGIQTTGNGGGDGFRATGGTTGNGIAAIGGATSGNGLNATATAGNGHGLNVAGQGSGHGLNATGGATGNGLDANGGATSGNGIDAAAPTSGDGMQLVGAGAGLGLDAAEIAAIDTVVDAIVVDTGTDIPARFDGVEGATFDTSTDSLEAIRNRGDAAWTTGTGLDAAGVRAAVGLASANLDTQLDALPTATENADALLKRDWTAVTGEAARSVLNALRAIRNKVALAAGTMTVYEEDDSTTAWTAAVTTDAAADPITEVDPT